MAGGFMGGMQPTIPPRSTDDPPVLEVNSEFDWNGRLSIDMIRSHTKTDDTPNVTDEQLTLYRATAIETAERYTSLLLKGQRTITEPIEGPSQLRHDRWEGYGYFAKPFYKHTLRYPSADGLIHMYGRFRRTFRVPIGTRTIQVPVHTGMLDLSNCCDPHAHHHMNADATAIYLAGFKSPDDVPSGVVLGCLMFTAWCIEHPGDLLVTQMNSSRVATGGIQGTNNIAQASGALELWRTFDPEAL